MIDPTRHLRLSGVLVTVADSGDRDEMNHPVSTEKRTPVRFWWHPAGVSETTNRAEVQTQRRTAYFGPGSTVAATSQLVYGGETWEFDGPTETWIHPTSGRAVGRTATLVRVS